MISALPVLFGSILYLSSAAYGRTDCSQVYFSGSKSTSGDIFCANGYSECTERREACCPDVSASPVELALVVMGPLTVVASILLVVFIIKTVVGIMKEDAKTVNVKRSKVPNIIQ